MDSRIRKKTAALLFLWLATAFGLAYAEFDPKECYRKCMEHVKDREKCEYICYGKK